MSNKKAYLDGAPRDKPSWQTSGKQLESLPTVANPIDSLFVWLITNNVASYASSRSHYNINIVLSLYNDRQKTSYNLFTDKQLMCVQREKTTM